MSSETSLITGWWVYTPFDIKNLRPNGSKKPKMILRWVVVNEYWLEISNKPNDSPLLSIHLGYSQIRLPTPEEMFSVTTIVLETSSIFGSFFLIIYSYNRFDMIALSKSLLRGIEEWNRVVESKNHQSSRTLTIKLKGLSAFAASKHVECTISPEGFQLKRQNNVLTVELSQIKFVHPTWFDQRQGTCFELQTDLPSKSDSFFSFQCSSFNDMKNFVSIILYVLKIFSMTQTSE